jgi:hypothetical protein
LEPVLDTHHPQGNLVHGRVNRVNRGDQLCQPCIVYRGRIDRRVYWGIDRGVNGWRVYRLLCG